MFWFLQDWYSGSSNTLEVEMDAESVLVVVVMVVLVVVVVVVDMIDVVKGGVWPFQLTLR